MDRGGRRGELHGGQDGSGRYVAARCTLRTLGGDALSTLCSHKSVCGGHGNSPAHLSANGPCITHPGLPAGLYRVELSQEGYTAQSHVVEIREGKTTTLTVKLKRE